ncbi:MAG: hypothetical protein WKF59_13855 [Chitinophagaceae bacterium]
MNFRLFKRNCGNINLELLCRDNSGTYFKTIGYYEFEKGGFLSSGKLSVTILKEFEQDYKELKNSNNLDDHGVKVNFMSIKESGLIAAFSRETIENVKIMYREKKQGVSQEVADLIGPFPHLHAMQFDKSLVSNGLKIDLLFSMDGFPQSFLDDEYKVEGGLGAYFQNEKGLSLNPVVEHKENYDRFYKMGLFSALNND